MTPEELRKLIEMKGLEPLSLPDHERDLIRSFIINGPEWPVLAKIIAHGIELARSGSETQTDPVSTVRSQGVAMGLREFLATLLQICAPKIEQEAEREASQHLRGATGRDSGGGY